MTVRELIAELVKCPPDALVLINTGVNTSYEATPHDVYEDAGVVHVDGN